MNDNQPSGRDYPTRPFVAASIAVFRDGKVLLASRSKPPYEDVFSIPGGIVETGESLQQAALRELMEEVGIVAREPLFVGPVEIIDRDEQGRVRHHIVIMVHTALWQSGEARTGPEAHDVRWVRIDEIDRLRTTPRLKEMLLRADALLGGRAPRSD